MREFNLKLFNWSSPQWPPNSYHITKWPATSPAYLTKWPAMSRAYVTKWPATSHRIRTLAATWASSSSPRPPLCVSLPNGLRPSPPPKAKAYQTRPWRTRSWRRWRREGSISSGRSTTTSWRGHSTLVWWCHSHSHSSQTPRGGRGDQNSAWIATNHDQTHHSALEDGSAASLRTPMASRAERHWGVRRNVCERVLAALTIPSLILAGQPPSSAHPIMACLAVSVIHIWSLSSTPAFCMHRCI